MLYTRTANSLLSSFLYTSEENGTCFNLVGVTLPTGPLNTSLPLKKQNFFIASKKCGPKVSIIEWFHSTDICHLRSRGMQGPMKFLNFSDLTLNFFTVLNT